MDSEVREAADRLNRLLISEPFSSVYGFQPVGWQMHPQDEKRVMAWALKTISQAPAGKEPLTLPDSEGWWWEWSDRGWRMRDCKLAAGGWYVFRIGTPLGEEWLRCCPGHWLPAHPPAALAREPK